MVQFWLSDEDDVRAFIRELDAVCGGAVDVKGHSVSTESDDRLVARALDHLRNSGRDSPDLLAARDRLLAGLQVTPLTYKLQSWQFSWDEQDQRFWSYTGPYAKDDRLVTPGDRAFKVFDVVQEARPVEWGVLLVERLAS